jgi:hypothetical protein
MGRIDLFLSFARKQTIVYETHSEILEGLKLIVRAGLLLESHCSPLYSLLFRRLRLEGSQFEVSPDKNFMRLYFQNNQSKMNWRHGLSGRASVLQVQSLKFKPLFHQKTKVIAQLEHVR